MESSIYAVLELMTIVRVVGDNDPIKVRLSFNNETIAEMAPLKVCV